MNRIDVVVPVYQGEETLEPLVEELASLRAEENGLDLGKLVLVWDGAIDRSDQVMSKLAADYPWVELVWLSRNYGQHAATVAGIAATTADWVATMDEDGLHDPKALPQLLRACVTKGVGLAYGTPANRPPHTWFRNTTSVLAKKFLRLVSGMRHAGDLSSFRVMEGPLVRSLVAYAGHDVYLDVALSWAIGDVVAAPVHYRDERRQSSSSGYTVGSLLSHFRRLIVTSGTRPLRALSLLGLLSMLLAFLGTAVVLGISLVGAEQPQGWASAMVVTLLLAGLVLVALGVISEYLSIAVNQASGRPLYMLRYSPPPVSGDNVPSKTTSE